MSALYQLWRICYAHDDANYHDYLVWLAASWLEFSHVADLDRATLRSGGDDCVHWRFASFVRGRSIADMAV